MGTWRWQLIKIRESLSATEFWRMARKMIFHSFAMLFMISFSTAQRLLLIEPAIEGVQGYDFDIYPHCVNERGHAAGVLVKREPNRFVYFPFVWAPEQGMILLPEPTTLNDPAYNDPSQVAVYGIRVLNLSGDGRLLLRIETDSYPSGFVLVGWSSATGYRVMRSENDRLFYTNSCMPRKLVNSSLIAEVSPLIGCYRDGYYEDEQMIYAGEGNITIYPFDYESMRFIEQGSYSVNLSSVFGGGVFFFIAAMSRNGHALVGEIYGYNVGYPFQVYRDEATQRWRGNILGQNSSMWGMAQVVSADGAWVAGRRRRPDNRYLPFMWHIRSDGYSAIDIDLPSRESFTPNYGDVVSITADGTMIVGSAQQRERGDIIASKAYQWTAGRGVEYLEEKYRPYIPPHYSFPFIIDMSANGRYLLLRVVGSCAGYGVLDTLGVPMFPDNPTVVMRNETASRITNAPDDRHAYPFVGDTITLAAIVRYQGRYYFSTMACGTELSGQWYVPGHHYRPGGGEDADFNFSHLRYTMPRRIYEWSGGPLRFEWYRTQHYADLENSLSPYMSNSRVIRVRVGRFMARGAAYHRWYMYSEDRYLRPEGLWIRNIAAQGPGTYRYYVRLGGDRWIGLHQPKPGAWRDPSQDEEVFNEWPLFFEHRSQNCDEADELAIRISIRAVADWVDDNPSNRQRKFVEWASSFVNVAYEWGGWWYGGRADDKAQHSGAWLRRIGDGVRVFYNGHAGYEGYGIDCSGLVAASARLAGYSFDQWRMTTRALEDTLQYSYCNSVTLGNLKAGDLLVKGGRHVVIVYRINHVNEQDDTITMDLQILHAAGEPNEPRGGNDSIGHKVLIESVSINGHVNSDQIETSERGNTTGINLTGYVVRRLRE
mgnify:CR=1 FL=1